MEKSLVDKCKKNADLYAAEYVNSMRVKHGNVVLYRMLSAIHNKKQPKNTVYTRRLIYANNIINMERQRIIDNMDKIKDFINTKDETISSMINKMKKECGIDENKWETCLVENINPTGEVKLTTHTNTIKLINSVYINLYIAYMFMNNTKSIYNTIKYCIDDDCKMQPMPVIINRNSGRTDAVNSIQSHGLMDF